MTSSSRHWRVMRLPSCRRINFHACERKRWPSLGFDKQNDEWCHPYISFLKRLVICCNKNADNSDKKKWPRLVSRNKIVLVVTRIFLKRLVSCNSNRNADGNYNSNNNYKMEWPRHVYINKIIKWCHLNTSLLKRFFCCYRHTGNNILRIELNSPLTAVIKISILIHVDHCWPQRSPFH